MVNLQNKTAVVTGGSRGIGQAIAVALAEAGAHVITNYNATPPDATKKLVEGKGGTFSAYPCNVASAESVDGFVKSVLAETKQIDILVNNAGITRDNLLIRMKEDEWDDVLNVNLKSTFLLTKLFGKAMMKKRTGSIINVSSVVGATGNAGQANYAASKAGMIGFSKSVARELATRNIRVNCIAPGYIVTEMTDQISDEVKETLQKTIPMGKLGSVKNISDAVLFLASDMSQYITGETLHINGGMHMP